MSVATRCTTVGSYLFGCSAVSGLIWADTIATWAGRLWVLCIVGTALCVLSRLFLETQSRLFRAYELGTEVGALAASAALERHVPSRRHLSVVGDGAPVDS